jgi:hypothetical protein
MAFAESFSGFFDDFAIDGTVNGVAVRGILDLETFDEGIGSVITQRTSYLLEPAAGVTPAEGHPVVIDGATYTVRQVLKEPPDGALKRLVLARA